MWVCFLTEFYFDRLNSEDDVSLKDVWTSTLHYFSGYAFPVVADAVKTLATVVVKGHTSTLKVMHQTPINLQQQKQHINLCFRL
jgi:hypothetical protein